MQEVNQEVSAKKNNNIRKKIDKTMTNKSHEKRGIETNSFLTYFSFFSIRSLLSALSLVLLALSSNAALAFANTVAQNNAGDDVKNANDTKETKEMRDAKNTSETIETKDKKDKKEMKNAKG